MMPRTTNIAINNSWSRQNKTTGGASREEFGQYDNQLYCCSASGISQILF